MLHVDLTHLPDTPPLPARQGLYARFGKRALDLVLSLLMLPFLLLSV